MFLVLKTYNLMVKFLARRKGQLFVKAKSLFMGYLNINMIEVSGGRQSLYTSRP